jgi:transcriptional regulator of PTS gene
LISLVRFRVSIFRAWRTLAPASITKLSAKCWKRLVQETEIQEPGSRGRPAVGLVVETEAWHYLSLRISRGRSSLRCAI